MPTRSKFMTWQSPMINHVKFPLFRQGEKDSNSYFFFDLSFPKEY